MQLLTVKRPNCESITPYSLKDERIEARYVRLSSLSSIELRGGMGKATRVQCIVATPLSGLPCRNSCEKRLPMPLMRYKQAVAHL